MRFKSHYKNQVKMKVYSSFSNTVNFQRSRVQTSSIYKRYALLFDSVIFNRSGCPIKHGDISSFYDYLSVVANDYMHNNDALKLSKNKNFQKLFVDLWDVVDNPEKINLEASSYVSEFDSEKIASFSWGQNLIDEKMGIMNHYKEYKAAAIVGADIRSDLGFNFLLKDRYKDQFYMNFAPIVAESIHSMHAVLNVDQLFSTDLIIPKFEDLSWDQILELRTDKNIQAFRQKFFSSINGIDHHIDEVISTELTAGLWDLAMQIKPDIGRSYFEAVTSNLPLPTMVNPFGLYYGAKSVIQNYRNQKDYSWIYFVQSMKEKR